MGSLDVGAGGGEEKRRGVRWWLAGVGDREGREKRRGPM
jgi:hypothetical protein